MTINTNTVRPVVQLKWFWYGRNYFFLFVAILSSAARVSGQNESELKTALEKTPEKFHDSIFYELFKLTRTSNTLEAKHYAAKSLQIAATFKHVSIQCKATRGIGYLFECSEQADSAEWFYRKAIAIALANKLTERLPDLYNDLGVLYVQNDVYDSALHNFTRCYDLLVNRNSPKLESICCSNLGLVYSYLENYEEALTYYRKALSIKRSNAIYDGQNLNLIDIASILNEQGSYQLAEQQLKQVQVNCKNECDDNTRTYLAYGLGYSLFSRGQISKSDSLFKSSLALARVTKNKKIAADALYFLSLISIGNHDYNLAASQLKEAEENAKEINHRRGLKDIYEQLAKVYLALNDMRNASTYQKLNSEVTQSIFNKNVANNVSSIRLNSQKRLTDKEIQEKNVEIWRAREFAIILALNVVLAFVLIYLIYRALRASWHNKKQMAYNMSVMLDERETKQRELFRVQLEKDELANRVRSFLTGPVATLAGLSNVFKNANSAEDFKLCTEKMSWLCSTIGIVLSNMHELVLYNNLLLNKEEIDIAVLIKDVHEEFKKIKSFLLLTVKVEGAGEFRVTSDKVLLLALVNNAIQYFTYASENPVVEVVFRKIDNKNFIIAIKHHSCITPEGIPYPSQFNYLTAMVIAGQLEGSILVTRRDDYTVFEIILPVELKHTGNTTLDKIAHLD